VIFGYNDFVKQILILVFVGLIFLVYLPGVVDAHCEGSFLCGQNVRRCSLNNAIVCTSDTDCQDSNLVPIYGICGAGVCEYRPGNIYQSCVSLGGGESEVACNDPESQAICVGGCVLNDSCTWAGVCVAPGTPTQSSPVNGQGFSDGRTSLVLDWNAVTKPSGCDFLAYTVYFGTTNPPAYLGGTSDFYHYFTVSNLSNTTYYWRLSAYSRHGSLVDPGLSSALSPVWSFRIEPPVTCTTPRVAPALTLPVGGARLGSKSC
jgi:hypothetical protein